MVKIFDVPMLNWQNKPIHIYINIYNESVQNLLWNIQDPNLKKQTIFPPQFLIVKTAPLLDPMYLIL